MTRPVVLAWSGGKDSSLALAALRADPLVEVVALLTTVTGDYNRISMHGVRRAVLEAQVAELGLTLVEATIPPAANNQLYEEAFASAWPCSASCIPGFYTLPSAISSWPMSAPIANDSWLPSAGNLSFRYGD